ncbi:fungal-specific transcription factor domain-containing protein [Stachybotrys elegans]|uniref:Fungal-specific transcription factor domain-containing protein n=1 Tax=Stachybotrys elegans TaxID=80388 RepID=A0A8K0WJV2_9HYPO|nr:fungal-specific transcription factor domain-containing protein [Stachybotrys elegans]
MGRKRIACKVCAAVKTLCSKGRPCMRCKRLSLVCSYGEDDPSALASADVARRLPKTGHTRSKAGCLSCRRRRKKCDEQLPVCGDCQRLRLECCPPSIGIGIGAEQVAHAPETLALSDPEAGSNAIAVTVSQLREDASPEWASAVADVFEDHILSTQFVDWIALIENEHKYRRNELANLANSAALVDLPIPCASDDEAGRATFLPPTALNNLTGITPFSLKDWSFGQRHLLNHFMQSVSRALVVVPDEENPFLRYVVPMVIENTMVRHALLALSACHLARIYPVFRQDLLLHRSLAMQALRSDLVYPDSPEGGLYGTSDVQICEGDSRTWALHLFGAKALLDDIDAHSLGEQPLQSMVELYNYLCCVTSATSDDVPPVLENILSDDAAIHPLFSAAARLYGILPTISQLGKDVALSLSPTQDLQLRAQDVELTIQSWAPLEETGSSRYLVKIRAAAFATQWALILRLSQITKKLPNSDLKITKATNNILSAISLIRPGSEVEAHILFPLFMAGVGSVTKPNRLSVEYRLKIVETTVGFERISCTQPAG